MCLKPTTITTTTPPSTSLATDDTPVTHSPLSDARPQAPRSPTLDVVQSPTQPTSTSLQSQVRLAITPLEKAPAPETSGRAATHKALTDWKNELKDQKEFKSQVDQLWNVLTVADYVEKSGRGGEAKYAFRFGAAQAVEQFRLQNPHLNLTDTAVHRVQAFIGKHAVLHSDIGEAYGRIQGGNPKAFRDWFHSFAGTVSLLGARAGDQASPKLDAPKQQQLLKAELMRGQLQATYTPDDADRLGRPLSPIVREGYGRGVKTGLWMAAAAVRTDQLKASLGTQLNKFEVYPVNHAFTYKGTVPTIATTVPTTLAGVRSVYIAPLGVQVVLKEAVDKDIHGFLGGRGLRSSASECADVCAQRMVEKIGAGDIAAALKTLDKAFDGVNAKAVKEVLGQVELMPNTLIAPASVDTLTASSPQQREALAHAYAQCVGADVEGLPFYVRQNLDVVRNLIGEIGTFGESGMPATVCGMLTDALQRASGLVSEARFMMSDDKEITQQRAQESLGQKHRQLSHEEAIGLGPAWHRSHERSLEQLASEGELRQRVIDEPLPQSSLHMERFYQAMQDIHHVVRFQNDWSGRAPAFDDAVAGLMLDGRPVRTDDSGPGLSRSQAEALRPNLTVERAPHALAMLDQIRMSLPDLQPETVGYLQGAYYETPDVLKASSEAQEPVRCDTVDDTRLADMDMIVMEPHPNNAAETRIQAHDPVALIENLFALKPEHARTLVMDVTLNHLGEDQISEVLRVAKPHIESGKLNLVLLQSGTKFFQNGMDLVNIGTAAIFNKAEAWGDFRDAMARNRMSVPKDDEGYIASLLSAGNKQASMDYLDKVRENTALLRSELDKQIPLGHTKENAYEVCVNTDAKTVYIAFKPTPAYLAKVLQRDPSAATTWEERAGINRDDYKNTFRPAFGDMATVDRSSFGFNVTNFGECGDTVRITLGIEEPGLLENYAQRVVEVGEQLYARAFST